MHSTSFMVLHRPDTATVPKRHPAFAVKSPSKLVFPLDEPPKPHPTELPTVIRTGVPPETDPRDGFIRDKALLVGVRFFPLVSEAYATRKSARSKLLLKNRRNSWRGGISHAPTALLTA